MAEREIQSSIFETMKSSPSHAFVHQASSEYAQTFGMQ